MTDRMPPPGAPKAGVTVAISAKPGNDRMKPPGTPDAPETSGKVPTDQAVIVRAENHCIDCKNYSPDTGECAKIEGFFDPQDACVKYFDPIEGDEDDTDTSEPDDDADDSAPGADLNGGRQ